MPKITPHKGGRVKRVNIRLTTEQKDKLIALTKHHDKSEADVIIDWINRDFDNLIAYVDKLTDYGKNDPTE